MASAQSEFSNPIAPSHLWCHPWCRGELSKWPRFGTEYKDQSHLLWCVMTFSNSWERTTSFSRKLFRSRLHHFRLTTWHISNIKTLFSSLPSRYKESFCAVLSWMSCGFWVLLFIYYYAIILNLCAWQWIRTENLETNRTISCLQEAHTPILHVFHHCAIWQLILLLLYRVEGDNVHVFH
jgi:hypothetical protein